MDDGVIRYDLERAHHGTTATDVTLLPPHVPDDGRSATGAGFRKRVLYLNGGVLPDGLIGAAADLPNLRDPVLRRRIDQLHRTLGEPGSGFEAESRLALICDRLTQRLRRTSPATVPARPAPIAPRLRDLLDAGDRPGPTLREAADILQAHPVHLVRSFTAAYGIAPHAYLIGRRVDAARRLLLEGHTGAEAAVAAGFYDQAHLTRMFRRYLGTTPGRYAAS